MPDNQKSYILGIDLGVVSLGWAAIEVNGQGPKGLLAAGVRCWDTSDASPSNAEQGKKKPANQTRRESRQTRRQLFRRAQRLRRTYRTLQDMGLLPPGPRSSTVRKATFDAIDQQAKEWLKQNVPALTNDELLDHTFVYRLRAAALDYALPPQLLGRVFFHLAQRRGYLSNRRSAPKEEKHGEVEKGISELEQNIRASGARTLGEYFSRVNPLEQRIRARWTSRKMYQHEFELIWNAQRPHHPTVLTDENKEKLFKALFFQRPLKSQKGLVGRCTLECLTKDLGNGNVERIYPFRRAPMACLEAQRIRYMQRINDLTLIDPKGDMRSLTQEERQTLYALAETHQKKTFDAIKKVLGLTGEGWKFSMERGGEKELPGNKTAVRIRRIIGTKTWENLSESQRKELVDTIIAYLSPEALAARLQKVWHFAPEVADKLSKVTLESGYHKYSRRAIRKLLPLLEKGDSLNTAIQKIYGGTQRKTDVHDLLPPVQEVVKDVRNPLVVRALTELRKVVNALIRKYGKPQLIRIELARDLKNPRKVREKRAEEMRQREKQRKAAAAKIQEVLGREAKGADIEKYLLAEECNWECPYTGRPITLEALLGDQPQFDVEHIWPFSRSLDNSFANKTLCYHQENRERKQNRTPFEAFGSNEQEWHEILARVERFKEPFKSEKLRRFKAESIPEDYPQRDLNDTRWISREAADYLGHLYGGRIDPSGKQRIFAIKGQLTAIVRQAWDLNSILGGGPEKERNDHRHHAIDAITIALADASLVQRISWAAARLPKTFSRIVVQIDPPWEGFLNDVRQQIHNIVVSYRPNRRVSGPLHDANFYTPPIGGQKPKHRKQLKDLSPKEVSKIVDDRIRTLVQETLERHGGKEPKKVFNSPENLPVFNGRKVKSVRIWVSDHVMPVGQNHRIRYVIPGNNHHVEIYAVLDAAGREVKWEAQIVSLYEAYQRKMRGQPIVCRDFGPRTRFKFSLAKGDYIEWVNDESEVQLLRVVGISNNIIEFRLPNDARPSTLVRKAKERIFAGYNTLLRRRARKVWVTPLGEVRPAND